MKKLIRLELQKNNWKPYWITTSITTLVMLGFILFNSANTLFGTKR